VAGIGRFNDGRLAELFLNGSKTGTDLDAPRYWGDRLPAVAPRRQAYT
jgi:hypothetical protein